MDYVDAVPVKERDQSQRRRLFGIASWIVGCMNQGETKLAIEIVGIAVVCNEIVTLVEPNINRVQESGRSGPVTTDLRGGSLVASRT